MTYKADDWCENQAYGTASNTYLQNFMAPEKLVLKIGAQVMLIKVRFDYIARFYLAPKLTHLPHRTWTSRS